MSSGKIWHRRDLLKLLGAAGALVPASGALGQGVASRAVQARPRGKFSGIPFHARFVDVGREAGLTAPLIYGPPDHKDYILETTGCGCAFLDYDNDGWLDILLLNGTRFAGAPGGTSNRLYKNNRNGTFADVTEKAGLLKTGWASAVTIGDYDNDGFDDIFITYWGQNVLYRNRGDGTFEDVTKSAGLEQNQRRWNSGCTWIDYNRDGHLDLFVANYLNFDPAKVAKPGGNSNCNWKGIPVNCGPRGLPPGGCLLYRNNNDGTFTDVSKESGVASITGSYCMTTAAADFDGDGWPDVYVACDSTPSIFFRNNRNGTFTNTALEAGLALNEDGMEQAGMGLGIGDCDLDGRLDLLKTHFLDDTTILYHNAGKGVFDDVTVRSGLAVETQVTGWGAGIYDFDNDGLPDLFWVTGSVYPEVENKLPREAFRTRRILFRNLGNGKFEELEDQAGPAILQPHASRGCAFGDFDNDGDIDILVMNLNEPPSLLRNDVTGGAHWLKVKLIGTKSNRSAVGATVVAHYAGKQQARALIAQSSYYSSDDPRLHFGLGTAESASLDIYWPSGAVEKIPAAKCDQLLTVKEGKGVIHSGW